jgi:hypothetical protein
MSGSPWRHRTRQPRSLAWFPALLPRHPLWAGLARRLQCAEGAIGGVHIARCWTHGLSASWQDDLGRELAEQPMDWLAQRSSHRSGGRISMRSRTASSAGFQARCSTPGATITASPATESIRGPATKKAALPSITSKRFFIFGCTCSAARCPGRVECECITSTSGLLASNSIYSPVRGFSIITRP